MLIFLSAILIFLIFAVVRHIYHHYIGNFSTINTNIIIIVEMTDVFDEGTALLAIHYS